MALPSYIEPDPQMGSGNSAPEVMCFFGTRPEVIKFAPVIRDLEKRGLRSIQVCSGQHRDLIEPLIGQFGMRIDHSLDIMRDGQTLNGIASRILGGIDALLANRQPDLFLVQGDTTTAMAGAQAAFNRQVPVGHIEAGLRSGNLHSPFPEEMNRRLVSQMATLHFASTRRNREQTRQRGGRSQRDFRDGQSGDRFPAFDLAAGGSESGAQGSAGKRSRPAAPGADDPPAGKFWRTDGGQSQGDRGFRGPSR